MQQAVVKHQTPVSVFNCKQMPLVRAEAVWGDICELPNQSTKDRKRDTQSLKLDRKLSH